MRQFAASAVNIKDDWRCIHDHDQDQRPIETHVVAKELFYPVDQDMGKSQ